LHAKPAGDAALGDVLLFRMRQGAVAKHLGLQSAIGAAPAFIHAYAGRGVVESPLSLPWRRRVVARFEFPAEA
ncbi:MAG: peptidase, partial [Sulfitobacter sp.]|nr:peptidase [Sulfitobacter sp.]